MNLVGIIIVHHHSEYTTILVNIHTNIIAVAVVCSCCRCYNMFLLLFIENYLSITCAVYCISIQFSILLYYKLLH